MSSLICPAGTGAAGTAPPAGTGGGAAAGGGGVSTCAGAVVVGGGTSACVAWGTPARPRSAKYSTTASTGMLISVTLTISAARRRCSSNSRSCSGTSTATVCAVGVVSWLKRSRNSRTVSSGSRPTSIAYERTNARLKSPPGSLEMSLRSRASSADAEILVLAEICLSEIPRRSRAWRSFPPKSSMGAVTLDNLLKRCQTHEQPDGCETRGARGFDLLRARSVDAANRNHRQRRSAADRFQRVDASDRMSLGLARGRKHRAEHQVVAASARDGGIDVRQRVHGAADQERGRNDRADARGGRRIRAQMDTGSAGGDGDVGAIVDEHARARALGRRDDLSHERNEIAIGQVALAHLDDVHAAAGGGRGAIDQRVRRQPEPAAIGDEMLDQCQGVCSGLPRASSSVSAPGLRRLMRERTSEPSSASPASAVMMPTPVTAPRAYGLITIAWSSGLDAAKRLCSQNGTHGATMRMNPASRK